MNMIEFIDYIGYEIDGCLQSEVGCGCLLFIVGPVITALILWVFFHPV